MSFATRLHSSWTLPLQSVLSAALFLASARPALAASTGENPAETAAAAVQCDSKSDLTAQLSLTGTRGTFTNLSPTCSYEIGIAAYRMFDLRQRNQAIFDWVTATIAPGTTLALNVELPDCGTQVDLFAGPVSSTKIVTWAGSWGVGGFVWRGASATLGPVHLPRGIGRTTRNPGPFAP